MINYNMQQISLRIATYYEPEENHPAKYINRLLEGLIVSTMMKFPTYLKQHGLIQSGIYIDGTKILANANKYSFEACGQIPGPRVQ